MIFNDLKRTFGKILREVYFWTFIKNGVLIKYIDTI